jgi:hypothetical protein
LPCDVKPEAKSFYCYNCCLHISAKFKAAEAVATNIDENMSVKMHAASFVTLSSAFCLQAYRDMLGFIGAVNEAIKNKKLSDPCSISKVMTFA